jgi:hypothetical protein
MSLIKTIQVLTEDEKKQFALFIASPVFTDRISFHNPVALSRLYDYLLALEADAGIDREVAIPYVYDGKTVAVSTFNSLSSSLHTLLKQFLMLKPHLEETLFENELTLAIFYRERGMGNAFSKTAAAIKAKLEALPERERDVRYYLQSYQLELEICLFESAFNQRSGDINLVSTIRSLDTFYALAKLEYESNLAHQRQIVSLEEEEALTIFDVLPTIRNSTLLNIPLIRCFQKAVEMILDPAHSEQHFTILREQLRDYSDRIPLDKMKLLLGHERNFCIRQYSAGKTAYLEILFDMYREHLALGVLYENGGITASMLHNIIRVALKLNQPDWADTFIEEHKERIVFSNHPEEVYHFNKASIAFEKKDYARTLHFLRQHYEDNYYIIDANLLELKLYFERKQLNHLLNKLNSFKVNIFKKSKDWLPAHRHKAINSFIDILRQMANDKIILNRQEAAIQKLYQKINDSSIIAEREWLLAKMGELSI